jgi:hypothetical protein
MSLLVAEPREHAADVSDLSFASIELLDGERWILAEGGIGRPFGVRLLLVNRGKTGLRLWQPGTGEADACPAVLLADDWEENVLRAPPTLRVTGVPQATVLEPGRLLRIDLDLLRLVGGASPAPGGYRLRGLYESVIPRSMGVEGVWTGRLLSEPREIVIERP